MKKYSIHIIFILIGIILVLYFMYCNVYEKHTKVQVAYELLQNEQETLLDDCEQLELKIKNLEGLNTDLENRLLAWKESAVTKVE